MQCGSKNRQVGTITPHGVLEVMEQLGYGSRSPAEGHGRTMASVGAEVQKANIQREMKGR